jgi:hypothetical protein
VDEAMMEMGTEAPEVAPASVNGREEQEGELLTLAEAAEYAGRAPATLRRAMRQQRIPRHYRQGTYGPELVVPRAALDAWLAEAAQRVEAQAAAGEAVPVEAVGAVRAGAHSAQGRRGARKEAKAFATRWQRSKAVSGQQ